MLKVGQRGCQRHPDKVRRKAVELFEKQYGYKATSTILGVPTYTVRDWKREWKAGEFRVSKSSCGELICTVMREKNEKYFWRGKVSVIREVINRSDNLTLSQAGVRKVMCAVKKSPHFRKLPAIIHGKTASCSVWGLIDS